MNNFNSLRARGNRLRKMYLSKLRNVDNDEELSKLEEEYEYACDQAYHEWADTPKDED